MITELLRRLFSQLLSDPEQLARFSEEPDAVLVEAGLGECDVAELIDALPLACADLPPAEAAMILDRCGPVESWSGETVAAVLCRVTVEPSPAPTWADEVEQPAATPPPAEVPVADHPPTVVEHPPIVADEPPVAAEQPPVVADPPVVAEDPPIAEDPPVIAEDPPVAEVPPVVTDDPPLADIPPIAAEEPPVVAEDPPGLEVLIPPTDPGREFVDFKSAVRAGVEAIAAGDADALAESIESVEPSARVELTEVLRNELLESGAPPDDPLFAVLDEQSPANGDDPEPEPDADAEDTTPTNGDLPNGDVPTGVESADLDVVGVAEKVAQLVGDGDLASAGSILQDLTPEEREAVLEQVSQLEEGQVDPAAGVILNGLDPDATDLVAALEDSRDELANRPPLQDDTGADGAPNPGKGGSGTNGTGASDDASSADPDFGAGAPAGSADAVAPPIPVTPVTTPVDSTAPAPGQSTSPTDDDAEPDFGQVGGSDFFGGEDSSGEVIPIDPADGTTDDDTADQTVGGDDFFGIKDPPPADDGSEFELTPEEVAELAAIEAEAADAIIDNLDG